jgi:alpha-tubulin suppressor-like RCC1 family protein
LIAAFFCFASTGHALALVSQTITFPAIPVQTTANPVVILGATASSGLPVTYAVVGGGNAASLTGSTITLSGTAGAVTVKATQPGNGTYAAAASVYQTFTVINGHLALITWKSIANGSGFVLAVKNNGTLWAWGNNSNGSLGDGSTVNQATPEQIGTATNWSAVAANYQSVALKNDGTLWTWGHNYYGELADGTETNRSTPQQIGSSKWQAIAAGYGYTIAIKSDGTLWQAGDYVDNLAQIDSATNWMSVSASYSHALAIKFDGTLWGWGDNEYGESGGGPYAGPPAQIGTDTNWKSASAGQYFSAAVKKDGTLWTWGTNSQDTLGNGTSGAPVTSPTQVGNDTNWQSVSAGAADSLALKTDGSLWAWGDNQFGQVGNGTLTSQNAPVRIGTDTNWQVTSAGSSSVAAKADGTLWIWGSPANNHGLSPVSLALGKPVSYAQGYDHAIVVRSDGTLWAWGNNQYGQLGDGTTNSQKAPEQIGTATNWKSVWAGNSISFAIKTDGTLWAWGSNMNLQLGLGLNSSAPPVLSPTQVGTAMNWQSVSVGYSGTLAVRSDGTLWAWGTNSNGQLGLGPTSPPYQVPNPVQAGTASNWKTVSTNAVSSFGVKTDGTLWAWGGDQSGVLGDGATVTQDAPEQIGSASNWQSVSAGEGFTVALKTDGTLWAWGDNLNGQLGDGTTTSRNVPEQIGTSTYWRVALAGATHTVAQQGDNTLWAWGADEYGQLGDGATAQQSVPERIQPNAQWSLASNTGMSGASFTLVATADGTLWGWGDDSHAQLAGATTDATLPQRLLPPFAPQSLTFPAFNGVLTVPMTLTASATSGLPVTYSASGTASVNGNQFTVSSFGSFALIGYQSGDANWAATGPTSASGNVGRNKLPQTILVPSVIPQQYVGTTQSQPLTATSGLPVTARIISGPASFTTTGLQFTAVGTVVIQLSQIGNDIYAAAPTVTIDVPVVKAPQTIIVPNTIPSQYVGTTQTGELAATSGLPVSYKIISGPATLSGKGVTFTGPGTVVVLASQAGNANYQPAPAVTITVQVVTSP